LSQLRCWPSQGAGMTQSRNLMLLVLLVCAAAVYADISKTDATLNTLGRTCMNKYQTILIDLYQDDKTCGDLITTAWEVTGKKCPSTKIGSDVHKCLSKSEASIKRWVDFVKECEVMNVAVRDEQSTVAVESEAQPQPKGESEGAPPGGEAGGEHSKPSCFPAWEEWEDFETYLKGKKNGATAMTVATALGVTLAGACAYLLA